MYETASDQKRRFEAKLLIKEMKVKAFVMLELIYYQALWYQQRQ